MTVTITLTDPTADESRAVRAYLDALHAEAPYVQMTGRGDRTPLKIDTSSVDLAEGFDLPNTPEPTTAEDAGAPDFDSAGYPWDERIHASSRATVADGTWRKKRGVSDELVAEVERELRALTQYEPTEEELNDAAAAKGEPYPAAPVQEQSAPEVPAAPVQEQSAPEVPDVPVQEPDSPPPPPAAAPNPFLAVMSRIGKSKLDKAKKDELLTAAGALDEKGNPSILVLNKRPELIDGFVALLDSEGV